MTGRARISRDVDEFQEWLEHGRKRAGQRAQALANRLTRQTGVQHQVQVRYVSVPYIGGGEFLDVVRKRWWFFGKTVATYDSIDGSIVFYDEEADLQ